MAVISTGSSIFRAKKSKLRRLLDTVDLEELPDSREHEELQATRSYLATIPFVLGLGEKTLPYFWNQKQEKLVVEEGTISPEKVPLPMGPPAWRENQVDFFTISEICYDR